MDSIVEPRLNRKTISNVVNDFGLNEPEDEPEKEDSSKSLEQTASVHFGANGLIDDHFSSSDDDQTVETKEKPAAKKPELPSTSTSKPNVMASRVGNNDIDDREIFDLGEDESRSSEEVLQPKNLEKNDSSSPPYVVSNSQQFEDLGDNDIFEGFLDNDNPVINLDDNTTDQPDPQELSSTNNSPKAGNFEDFFLSSKALKRKESDSESEEKLPEIQLSQGSDSHRIKRRSPSLEAQRSTQDSKNSKIDDLKKYIEDGLRELEEEEEMMEQEKVNEIQEDPEDTLDEIALFYSKSPSLSPPPEFLDSSPVHLIDSHDSPIELESGGIKELDNMVKSMSNDNNLKDLDPELLAIQEKVRTRSSEAQSADSKSKKRKGAKLQIACTMYKEPNDPDEFGEEFYEPINFVIYEKDTFNRIIEAISEIKRIPQQLLVLTYKNLQLFSLATPNSVNMNQPMNEVIVYIKGTYDKLVREKKLQLSELLTRESQTEESNSAVDLTNEDENSPISQQLQTEVQSTEGGAAEDEFSDMFKPTEFFGIKLRNKSGKDSLFKVHSGTKLTSLVEAYISKNNLSIDLAAVKLKFDGDPIELSQTVGETEVEDGDLLDIFY
ncbi:hypothetical protein CONCODRAFT_68112 [Conidiobolus coronatus NRRL 28638]|uniref:Rad60/SUMO-like domain-containing protein n=1 Tax=Conidiobolus coronatus (strain ATCC 28846 / CBS 209.66 / NRRL 28638) TaxID=796925 RepID=A0A137PFB6_CONC2|nr:hypothetical protein CONCODRAFT_68112 [Conidiobolus coronatus NRRL 28638]|eukprot:KXN73696.1 hypothetical protein CONCODRAFT_68112 [Conidiobolus coronatus NRRL 28638]